MSKSIRILLICLLFLLLFVIRGFASTLFYDPLIEYFKNDYLYANLPKIDRWQLIINLFFRYVLNSVVSIGIIWLVFQRKYFVRFSCVFLAIAFVILAIIFTFLLNDNFESGYLLPFYIRRFLIHPLFLLLLIPSFYSQKLNRN